MPHRPEAGYEYLNENATLILENFLKKHPRVSMNLNAEETLYLLGEVRDKLGRVYEGGYEDGYADAQLDIEGEKSDG